MDTGENRRAYWRRNLAVSAILLGLWFVVTFVVSFFARELSFTFFWLALQFLDGSTRFAAGLWRHHLVLCPLHGQAR